MTGLEPIKQQDSTWSIIPGPPDYWEWQYVFDYQPTDYVNELRVRFRIDCTESGYRVTVAINLGQVAVGLGSLTITPINGWSAGLWDGSTQEMYKDFGCTDEWTVNEIVADVSRSPLYEFSCSVFIQSI
jgi:hypothetical protein